MLNLPTEPYRYDAPDEYRVDPRTPSVRTTGPQGKVTP